MNSSTSYGTTTATQLNIGLVSSTFSLTTPNNYDPDAFNFSVVYDAPLNQVYTSNTITLAGITNGVSSNVSLSGWGTLYKN